MSDFRRKKRRPPVADINVVPYIDVMMVLLIVFMITAPMLTQGVKVDLPTVNTQPLPDQQQDTVLVVSIKANGHYFIDLGSNKDKQQPVTVKTLGTKVAKLVRANPHIRVLINGDAQVHYGEVVAAMATLQQAGIAHVGLLTQPVNR